MGRQFRRDDRPISMDLGAGMARDEAYDPLDLVRLDPDAGVDATFTQAVEPERAVGIDHDFDDLGVCKRERYVRPHGGAQHPAAAVLGERTVHRSCSVPIVRRPAATCRPTCATNASNRSRPTARPA
jgi:hypothetical protein